MAVALVAPEFLLLLALQERLVTSCLLEKVREFHPHLVKPGLLARMYHYIRGPAKSKYVST